MQIDLLDGLNPEQQRAVITTDGPLLIMAGAGSGKTKTLTHRVAYIISQKLANPDQILAVTFTNKAAKEMRQRVWQLMNSQNYQEQPEPSRWFMPYMGTFHSICVRLLRQDGDYIGLASNFVIFDESDRQALIKQISKRLLLDEKQFPPRLLASIISSAKNELINPDEFSGRAQTPTQKTAAKVFPIYERDLKKAGAVDFDDLIGRMVSLLDNNPEIRQKWQAQFKYIMIDEYQDTNAAQYKLIKLLTNDQQNIAVVGDDWQCFPEGSKVTTIKGKQKIEDIKTGDMVLSASGYGKSSYFKVTSAKKFDYNGELVCINTSSGKQVICTPNHLLFARWGEISSFFVYLMYSQEIGYRIGVTKGSRFDGKKHDIGLRVRANQERSDRVWVLKVCETRQEAIYNEALLSYQYGIPMTVFKSSKNLTTQLDQSHIDSLYKNIDTKKRAKKLMKVIGLELEYPHFLSQATTTGSNARINVNVVLFGDKRTTIQSPWSASRISINTTNEKELNIFKNNGYSVRGAKNGTFRSEIHNLDYGHIEDKLAGLVGGNGKFQVSKYAFITENKFLFMPAAQIHPGMLLPVTNEDSDSIAEDMIVSVTRKPYKGKVYDLDIDKVHNYIVSDHVVHNSIYSWRGADFRNILNFEKDYPKCTVIRLEQNYRSTKHILDAAHAVISKNKQRSDKKLWTAAEHGEPIQAIAVLNERAEGDAILRRIKTLVDMKLRKHKDFAILYRTNAQSRSLEEQFIRSGVPYKIVGGVRFYDRAEIKDILAYLRLIYQPEDIISFGRVVNVPTRGVGATSVQNFLQWQVLNNLSLDKAMKNVEESPLTPRAKKAIADFYDVIKSFRSLSQDMPVAGLLEKLLKRIDYYQYLDDGSPQGEARAENVRELLSVAKAYVDVGLDSFLEEIALVSDLDNLHDTNDSVTLMTLHAAKGLEFPIVFMPGMEESLFPHSRALFDQSEMEEERRLCYVGMTRAQEELYMIYADSRVLYGGIQHNAPSRFLNEIDSSSMKLVGLENTWKNKIFDDDIFDDTAIGQVVCAPDISEPRYVLELSEGDRVRHQLFGDGTVLEIVGDNVAVYFKGRGTKKLNISFAPLQKL